MLFYYGDSMEEYRRWEDIIKMEFKEIGDEMMNWMEVGHDRDHWRHLVSDELNLRVPYT